MKYKEMDKLKEAVTTFKRLRSILFLLVVLTLLSIPFIAVRTSAESIDVQSGNVYYANLEGSSGTVNWMGLKITHNGIELYDSPNPFLTITFNLPIILGMQFPGYNLKDNLHYYGAMLPDTFNLNNLQNISVFDLTANNLFSQSQFSTFYPGYDDYSDNPYKTFCCNYSTISVGGQNFSALNVKLSGVNSYYLLKYNNSGVSTPLFLSQIKDTTCFNSSSCVSEMMLPINTNQYNFFAISKVPPYNYTVFIDGVETNTFPQTALPYNLTVEVRNLYTGEVVPNIDVMVAEDNGQNIFIPYRLSGITSKTYSIGKTNLQGRETFLVAPTVYPSTVDNYSIYVAALFYSGEPANTKQLYVTSADALVAQSKPIKPTILYDNSKAAVNAMNQINSFLFKWSSQMVQAKKFMGQYEINTGVLTITDLLTSSTNISLKTGAPNVMTIYITKGGVPQSGYVQIKETQGYLVMNPAIEPSGLSNKTRKHFKRIPEGQEFIITPTSLGVVNSNVTLEILDSNGGLLYTKDININPSLNIVSGGLFYNNDLLKTIVNSMNQIIYSLYYSLNY